MPRPPDPPPCFFGPYTPPAHRVGDWVDHPLRGRAVKIKGLIATTWGPWPAVQSGPVLAPLVDAELLRAIRSESAEAVAYHWRVYNRTASRWRREAGIENPRQSVPGTRLQVQSHMRRITRLPRPNHARAWTAVEDAVIRSGLPIAELAALLPGRSRVAISHRRRALGVNPQRA